MSSSLNEKFCFTVFICYCSFFCTSKIYRSRATGQDSFLLDEFISNPNENIRGDNVIPTDDVPDVNLNLQILQTVHSILQTRKNTSFVIEASESEIFQLITLGMIQEAQVIPLTTLLEVYDAMKEDRTFHPETPYIPTMWPEQGVNDDTENPASVMQENISNGQIRPNIQENINDGSQTASMMQEENVDNGQTAPSVMQENVDDGQIASVMQENSDDSQTAPVMQEMVDDGQIASVMQENSDDSQTTSIMQEMVDNGQITSVMQENIDDGQTASMMQENSDDSQTAPVMQEMVDDGQIASVMQENSDDSQTASIMQEMVDNGQITSVMQENIDDGQTASIMQENVDDGQITSVMQENIDNGQTASVVQENINDGQYASIMPETIINGDQISPVVQEDINDSQTDDVNSNFISASVIFPETIVLQDSFPENIFQRSATQANYSSTGNLGDMPNENASRNNDFTNAQATTTIINSRKTATNASHSIFTPLVVENDLKLDQDVSTITDEISVAPMSISETTDISLNKKPSPSPLVSEHSFPNKTTPKLSLTASGNGFGLLNDIQKKSNFNGEHEGRADIETNEIEYIPDESSPKDLPGFNQTNNILKFFSRPICTTTEKPVLSDDTPSMDPRTIDLFKNYFQHHKMFHIDKSNTSEKSTPFFSDDEKDSSVLQPVEYVYEKMSVKLLDKESKLLSSLAMKLRNETWFRPILEATSAKPPKEDVLSSSTMQKTNSTKSTGYRYCCDGEHNFKKYDTSETQPSEFVRCTLFPFYSSRPNCGQLPSQPHSEKSPFTPVKKSSPCLKVNFDDSAFVRSPASGFPKINVNDETSNIRHGGNSRSDDCGKFKVRESNGIDRSYSTSPKDFMMRDHHRRPFRKVSERHDRESKAYSRNDILTIPNNYKTANDKRLPRISSSSSNRKHNKGRPKSILHQSRHRWYKKKGPKKHHPLDH